MLAVCIVLASLIYLSIENKFRYLSSDVSASRILLGFLIPVLILVGISTSIINLNGMPYRLNIIKNTSFSEAEVSAILLEWPFEPYQRPNSMKQSSDFDMYYLGEYTDSRILIIGDSHAKQYWNSFSDEVINKYETSVFFKTSSSFPPTDDLIKTVDFSKFDKVVFSYFWALRMRDNINQRVRCCGDGKLGVVGVDKYQPITAGEMDENLSEFKLLISKLISKGIEVAIILDNPFGEELDPKTYISFKALNVSINEKRTLLRKKMVQRRETSATVLQNLVESINVEIIDPLDYFCNDLTCPMFDHEGNALYTDYDHLSMYAAKHHTSKLVEKLLD